ncbi:MAG: flagellar biosynthetic protein FliR [Methylophilaceae bacterium]
MISISSELLQAWISGLLWPLTRVLGLIAVSPILGHPALPPTVKLGLGLMFTLIVIPTMPAPPVVDLMSLQSLLILLQQLIIGVAMGLTVRIAFAAVELAGQLSGMTMGLGFASFYDPQSQGQSTAISQLYGLLAMLLFLAINGHLLLFSALAESFSTLPIQATATGGFSVIRVFSWGEKIFSAGVHLSLPVIAALLMTNIALGILSRTAPQLNLFGIGFPVTLIIGFLAIAMALPGMTAPLNQLFVDAINAVRQLGLPALPAL